MIEMLIILQYYISMRKTIYKSNKNIVYSCKYHVVWCPKYRRKVLINGVDLRLKELIQSIADEWRCLSGSIPVKSTKTL